MTFRIIDDIGDSITLFFIKFSSPDPWVDSEDLTDKEPKPPSNSFNLLKGKWDSSLAINVGVKDTMDVFEVGICIFDDE